MAAVISLYFLFFLLTLSGFYGLGVLVLRCFKYEMTGSYTSFFYRSLAGIVTSVFLFSVFVSSFKTVQWGILLVALMMWYEFRRVAKNDLVTKGANGMKQKGIGLRFLPLLFLTVLVFAWFACFTFKWDGDFMYAIPHKDKVYYTNISSALTEFGFENRQGAYYPKGIEPVTEPYHYFDLWLTAMLSFFTAKPAVLVVSLLCLPLCALLAVAGILSIIETRTAIRPWHYIAALLLLFIRGLYLEQQVPQIAWAENFTESVMEFKSEKLGVLYIFAMCSFRIFLNGNWLPGLVSFLILPVISIGNFPGVAGGVFLFAIIALVRKKVDLGASIRVISYCLLISGFIYAFYHFMEGSNVYLEKGLLVFTDLDTINFQSIKIAMVELFVRVVHNPWRTVLMHLPFLLLAWLAAKENIQYRRAFLLVACIYFISLATYGFFYKLADAPQFYTNNLPLLNLLLIVGAALILVSNPYRKTVKGMLMTCLAGILSVMMFFAVLAYRDNSIFTELYDDKYLCAIDSIHQKLPERAGVAIFYDPKQTPDLYNCDMSGPNLLYLPFFTKFRVPVDLNVFENRELTWGDEMGEIQKRFMRRSPFQKFVQAQANAGTFVDITTSQLDYLRKEQIRYVVVSPGITPDRRIVALVRKRVMDERSGEQLLILNDIP